MNTTVAIVFHGLNNYDHHFLISKLHKSNLSVGVDIIPKNTEKFLSFSIGDSVFKDSFEFLGASLSSLVDDLMSKGTSPFYHVNKVFSQSLHRDMLYRKGLCSCDKMQTYLYSSSHL